MAFSYYTIENLHAPGEDRRLRRFLTLPQALTNYRGLSNTSAKALGISDGPHSLGLVRCMPVFPDDAEGEDVLDLEHPTPSAWQNAPEAVEAAAFCISVLKLRYCFQNGMFSPVPKAGKLPKRLRKYHLRPGKPGVCDGAIRWAYVVGEGLLPYKLLNNPRDAPPLVLYYLADCSAADGRLIELELAPWEFDLLARRTAP